MNQTLINRYQNGGDIYARIQGTWGQAAADALAAAAQTGDATHIQSVFAQFTTTVPAPLDTSTADIFACKYVSRGGVERSGNGRGKLSKNALDMCGIASLSGGGKGIGGGLPPCALDSRVNVSAVLVTIDKCLVHKLAGVDL